ncbi:hypothetical protein [Rhodoferax sp. GW822-FHT02A01]|uniref:hypothetical protein n=1 Tax=Rhodoferax sp. GW822-FHT02A01 TaxID=3141537 RepID=UPI00315DF7FE
MTNSIPPSVAAALLSAVPAGSIVHKIVGDFDWLRELTYEPDPKARQEMSNAIGRQQDYLRATGERL